MNNRDEITSSIRIQLHDELTVYASIPSSSPILEAIQYLAKIHSFHSTGLYTLLQRIASSSSLPSSSSSTSSTSPTAVTQHTLQQLSLNVASLEDIDVYIVCSVLVGTLPQLASLQIAGNHLTDTSAAILAQWLASGRAPALTHIEIGSNMWWGEGLRDLLCSLRKWYAIQYLVGNRDCNYP